MNPRLGFVSIGAIIALSIIAISVASQWAAAPGIKLLPIISNTYFNTQIGKIKL